jgi:COP9 signalosome complex subunit 7
MTSDKTDKNASSSSSNNPLEQFVLLAKSAKGAAAMELIRQVLAAPGVFVFGELLDMPNIKEVTISFILMLWFYNDNKY